MFFTLLSIYDCESLYGRKFKSMVIVMCLKKEVGFYEFL